MKLYDITIRPVGPFGTPLKGDTLLGHFVWQVVHNEGLVAGGVERLVASYCENPCVIFSSAFPRISGNELRYALKKPDLPSAAWPKMKALDKSQRIRQAKDFKRLTWMIVGADLSIDLERNKLVNDRGLADEVVRASKVEIRRELQKAAIRSFCEESPRQHNTINRITGTTGKGPFAPYVMDCSYYQPGATLSLFTLIDEQVTSGENVSRALENIGKFGFGKDASVGMGRFAVESCREIAIPPAEHANACYCLAPCVPEQGSFHQAYFVPFVRFGKHGDGLARSRNPFKNPVIMADEGAVFFPKDPATFQKPFIGRGITGLSKSCESTVTQGFAPYLPIRVEI